MPIRQKRHEKKTETPPTSAPEASAAEPPPATRLSVADLVPLFVWRPMDDDERMSIKSLSPTEAFMIWLKASVVTGFVLASPLIFYFIWVFCCGGIVPARKAICTHLSALQRRPLSCRSDFLFRWRVSHRAGFSVRF